MAIVDGVIAQSENAQAVMCPESRFLVQVLSSPTSHPSLRDRRRVLDLSETEDVVAYPKLYLKVAKFVFQFTRGY